MTEKVEGRDQETVTPLEVSVREYLTNIFFFYLFIIASTLLLSL